ncbi:hypothetical protein PENTCL1PPCAC_14935, partial [Pristionchus entomophagus]
MDNLLLLVHIDRSHSINSTAFRNDHTILLVVVGFEMAMSVCVVLFHPIFRYVVMKSRVVHRNGRLQLCTAGSVYSIGVLSRFYLFYCQYTGIPDEEIVYIHLAAGVTRDFSKTLAVFILTESFNRATVITNEYLK